MAKPAEPTLTFSVAGVPKPQPRPKAQVRRIGGRSMAHIYTPSTGCKEWRDAVAAGCRLAFRDEPLTAGMRVRIVVYTPRPQRLCKKSSPEGPVPMIETGKGDADNYAKAVLDAIEGILFVNDAQVYSLKCDKFYAAKGCRPGAVVKVWVNEEGRDG